MGTMIVRTPYPFPNTTMTRFTVVTHSLKHTHTHTHTQVHIQVHIQVHTLTRMNLLQALNEFEMTTIKVTDLGHVRGVLQVLLSLAQQSGVTNLSSAYAAGKVLEYYCRQRGLSVRAGKTEIFGKKHDEIRRMHSFFCLLERVNCPKFPSKAYFVSWNQLRQHLPYLETALLPFKVSFQ
jgi:hypothetical protein